LSALLPFIIAGLVTGSVYGLAACGLVVTYTASGVFNFAHGAVAAAAAYFFYFLKVQNGWDWKPAFAVSVLGVGVVFGLLFEFGARRIARQPMAMRIVGTIGVVLAIEALATLIYGPNTLEIAAFLPGGTRTFRAGGVDIGWNQLIIACVSIVVMAALIAVFRWTRTGLTMRAVVADPDLAGLHGTSPVRVRRVAWVIGSTLASLSGVLLAPLIGISAIALTALVVAAIGAATVGAFRNLPLTYAGGLILGVLGSVSTKYVLNVGWLSGLPDSLPFIVLLVGLLVIPKRRLMSFSHSAVQLPSSRTPRRPLSAAQLGAAAFVVGLLLLVPLFVGPKLIYYSQSMSLAILLLSLGLLVRTAGQVSLCHAAFAGLGACAFSQVIVNFGLPWPLALIVGALIVVPVAALVAIPAIRMSGLFLALASLGFGLMVENLIYPLNIGFTQSGSGRVMPRPAWANTDTRFYYLLVGCVVLTAIVIGIVDRSRLGRVLRGVSEAPTAVGALGLDVRVSKVFVFCISGFFAGVAGILYGSTVHFATYTDPHFVWTYSLVLLVTLAIVPLELPWYALFAIPVAVIPGYINGAGVSSWLDLVFGASAVMVAYRGEVPMLKLGRGRRLDRVRQDDPIQATSGTITPLTAQLNNGSLSGTQKGLEVTGITVRFGGLTAVEDVSLDAPMGRITGLIGPNGAGKTTTFNACSGLIQPASGQVHLRTQDVTSLGSAARARLGLGRTFQIADLCESLSVTENVRLGSEAAMAGASPVSQIAASRAANRESRQAAREAIAKCGISAISQVPVSQLSTGERRMVEVARCLAGRFDVLLLDEPSAGLDNSETARLGELLVSVVAERHCGILLVEHDMALVMRVCEYVYVLDSGRLLFEGPPEEAALSPAVKGAYLGLDAVAESAAADTARGPA
jgi:ABC-type branched-subunit amino acid transport system ATPase component/branched-subunit amino acid ABC-type transport system permease component